MTNDARPSSLVTERDFVERVWNAIRALQPRQRAALLLNVHDSAGTAALELASRAGLASMPEIATLVDIPAAALRRLWTSLPLDDLAIGAQLGITWVQAAKLRHSARAVLARRLADGRSRQTLNAVAAAANEIAALATIWRAELNAARDDDHAPADLLEALVTDRLGEADREAVGSHVEVCAECAARAITLREAAARAAIPAHARRRGWIVSRFRRR